jgi:hypothetical protein
MKPKTPKNYWSLPPDLHARTVAYAKRLRIEQQQVIELAVSDFLFGGNPEDCRTALSKFVELALTRALAAIDRLEVPVASLGTALDARPTLPENRWDLPFDLHVHTVAGAARLRIAYDDLVEFALVDLFDEPLEKWGRRDALASVVAAALAHYLKAREGDYVRPLQH